MSSLRTVAKNTLINSFNIKKSESVLIVFDKYKKKIANTFYAEAKKLSNNIKKVQIPVARIHGQEPSDNIACLMRKFDIQLLLTSKSLSHTKARRDATKKGARIASLPGITNSIMKKALNADLKKMNILNRKLQKAITGKKYISLKTSKGTNLKIKVRNRKIGSDTGLLLKKKDFGNLPAGETGFAPLFKGTTGTVIFDASFAGIGLLTSPIKIKFKNGMAVSITGKRDAKKLFSILKKIKNKKAFMVAEFAIGTNHKAVITGNILEDEKVKSTCHIALGNNMSDGGKNNVPIHLDGVIKSPTIFVDKKRIMDKGRFLI